MSPESKAAPAKADAVSHWSSTTQVMKFTGTASNYNAGQRNAARFADNQKRRWEQPVGLATAAQVDALRGEVAELKSILTGERIA